MPMHLSLHLHLLTHAPDRTVAAASYAVLQNLVTCGMACDLFISHAWDEGVFEFIDNALNNEEVWPAHLEGAYICFLSNPQVRARA